MQTRSNAITIDTRPYAGWELVATHLEDEDAMDDLYTLDLWPPDADQPAHSFATHRYALGWNVIDAAVAGSEGVQKAMHWWAHNHTTVPYEIHRILVAIDETTWASRPEIAERLRLPSDELDLGTPYGDALATAQRHGILEWRNQRTAPYAALTSNGYNLIHPDDQQSADSLHQELALTLAIEQRSAPAPPASKAFLKLNRVFATATADISSVPPPTTAQPQMRAGHHI
jgi:hypothetical protein